MEYTYVYILYVMHSKLCLRTSNHERFCRPKRFRKRKWEGREFVVLKLPALACMEGVALTTNNS
jgi:hypothetical protein